MTPHEKTSHLDEYSLPDKIYGQQYNGVPTFVKSFTEPGLQFTIFKSKLKLNISQFI